MKIDKKNRKAMIRPYITKKVEIKPKKISYFEQ